MREIKVKVYGTNYDVFCGEKFLSRSFDSIQQWVKVGMECEEEPADAVESWLSSEVGDVYDAFGGLEPEEWDQIKEALRTKVNALVDREYAGFVRQEDGQWRRLDNLAGYMDDEIREAVHGELAPCTDQAFYNEYNRRHVEKYGRQFNIY